MILVPKVRASQFSHEDPARASLRLALRGRLFSRASGVYPVGNRQVLLRGSKKGGNHCGIKQEYGRRKF